MDSQESATDPDLGKLVAAWPALPEAIRRAILAMVDAAKGRDIPADLVSGAMS